MAIKELSGERFGRLYVMSLSHQDKHHKTMWLCSCDCGRLVVVGRGNLVRGKTRSCGCLRVDAASKPKPKKRRLFTTAGYEYEFDKNHPLARKSGIVLTHRKVWFDAYGEIPEGHVIHHINHDKIDNRLENLELVSGKHHNTVCHPFVNMWEPWNKGTTEMAQYTCFVCGISYERPARIKRGAEKHSGVKHRNTCSRKCQSIIANNARKKRLAYLEEVEK